MNYLLLSVGILLMSISAVHCKRIRGRLSDIKAWVRNGGTLEAAVFCAACGILVLVITWEWSY